MKIIWENVMIEENLQYVQETIRRAEEEAGRKPGEVTLIAVSKTKPVSMIEEAYACGCRDFLTHRLINCWL